LIASSDSMSAASCGSQELGTGPSVLLASASDRSYNSYMATVGVRELKNQLTRYLRRTRRGEPVVVTDRGRPVAILGPVTARGPLATREERLARLASQGLVTLPTRKPQRLPRVRVAGSPVSKTILEERR